MSSTLAAAHRPDAVMQGMLVVVPEQLPAAPTAISASVLRRQLPSRRFTPRTEAVLCVCLQGAASMAHAQSPAGSHSHVDGQEQPDKPSCVESGVTCLISMLQQLHEHQLQAALQRLLCNQPVRIC